MFGAHNQSLLFNHLLLQTQYFNIQGSFDALDCLLLDQFPVFTFNMLAKYVASTVKTPLRFIFAEMLMSNETVMSARKSHCVDCLQILYSYRPPERQKSRSFYKNTFEN
jgi:hypothetical protein